MKTAAQFLTDSHRSAEASERLRYGKVDLPVTDLDRAVNFWTAALGSAVRCVPTSGMVSVKRTALPFR